MTFSITATRPAMAIGTGDVFLPFSGADGVATGSFVKE